jgi:hypothetical protein
MLKLTVPVFVRMTFCGLLLVPTDWLANVRLVGEKLTDCDEAMPASISVTAPKSRGAPSRTKIVRVRFTDDIVGLPKGWGKEVAAVASWKS